MFIDYNMRQVLLEDAILLEDLVSADDKFDVRLDLYTDVLLSSFFDQKMYVVIMLHSYQGFSS